MFDVAWTDPARETIGERRKRKQPNARSRPSSTRSSRSSESGPNPPLSKLAQPSTNPALHPAKPSSKFHPEESSGRQVSSAPTASDATAHDSSGTTKRIRIPPRECTEGHDSPSHARRSSSSGPPESVFSTWSEKTCGTDVSWSSVIDSSILCAGTSTRVVQPLSPTSFVTQTTEVTVSPRNSLSWEEQIATLVQISTAGKIQHIPDSPSTHGFAAFDLSHLPVVSDAKPRIDLKNELPLSPISPSASSTSYANTQQKRWPKHSLSRGHTREGPPSTAETWKPPEAWECHTASPDSSYSLSPTTTTHTRPWLPRPLPSSLALSGLPHHAKDREAPKSPPASTEIVHLQRNIRRMEAASKKIMLERLREEWTDVVDPSLYCEMELEKQMWMLTALRSFDGPRGLDRLGTGISVFEEGIGKRRETGERGSNQGRREREESRKVLSLFENHASASSLAAMIAQGTELHHLSTSPLSPKQFPHTMPLTVPSATPHLPYASNIFSSVHALCLPSLLPSFSIPTVLKECHRVLISPPHLPPQPVPGSTPWSANSAEVNTTPSNPRASGSRRGTLHLMILDPTPLPGTLGPCFRSWLEDHLVLNLEKQFLCINPSRLFPGWLADAGLQAEGSKLTNINFFASVPSATWSGFSPPASSRRNDEDGHLDLAAAEQAERERRREKDMEDEDVTQELKSLVGRMLWKQMWGSYVKADKWWWEDERLVDECERMGTVWEYAVIEAVKGE